MADFQARIINYVVGASDTAAMTDYLTSGAAVIVDRLPIDKALINATTVADSGSGVTITGKRLIKAHKLNYNAPLIDSGMVAQVIDILSVFYATAKSPKSYILGTNLHVVPGGGTGIVVPYPTVLYSATSITSFPSELVEAVVLYAAIKSLHQIINTEMTTNMDAVTVTMPTAPTLASPVTYSYTDASGTTVSQTTVGSLGTAPSYIKPVVSLTTAPSDLTISASAPTAPSAPSYPDGLIIKSTTSATTVGSLDAAPTYSVGAPAKPVFVVASGTAPTALGTPSITYANASVATAVVQPIFSIAAQLTTLTTELNTNYDIEFAQAKINEIQALIGEFQANSTSISSILGQNANRETDVNTQNAIQELQQDVQQYSATVSRYSSELGKYSTDIDKQVSEHNLNLQAFVRDSTSQMFDALNAYNKTNSIYLQETQQKFEQAKTTAQEASQNAQLEQNASKEQALLTLSKEHQEYASQLQRYIAQREDFNTQVNKEVQEYGSNLGKWDQQRNTELQQYNSDIQNALNLFNKESVIYDSTVREALQEANMDQQRLLDDAQRTDNIALQNEIQESSTNIANFNLRVQEFQSRVSNYSSEINDVVQEFNSKVGQVTQKHEGLLKQMDYLQKLYEQELTLHLG